MRSFREPPAAPFHGLSAGIDFAAKTLRHAATRRRESVIMPMISALRSAAVLCFLALAMLAHGCGMVRAQGTAPGTILVVGTKEAPPFAIKQQDGSWSGISIELWKRIADESGLRFRLVETQSLQDLLDGVANGAFNVGVAAVTVTAARERRVDFTQRDRRLGP